MSEEDQVLFPLPCLCPPLSCAHSRFTAAHMSNRLCDRLSSSSFFAWLLRRPGRRPETPPRRPELRRLACNLAKAFSRQHNQLAPPQHSRPAGRDRLNRGAVVHVGRSRSFPASLQDESGVDHRVERWELDGHRLDGIGLRCFRGG
jgi:hypothetical protein